MQVFLTIMMVMGMGNLIYRLYQMIKIVKLVMYKECKVYIVAPVYIKLLLIILCVVCIGNAYNLIHLHQMINVIYLLFVLSVFIDVFGNSLLIVFDEIIIIKKHVIKTDQISKIEIKKRFKRIRLYAIAVPLQDKSSRSINVFISSKRIKYIDQLIR